MSSIVRKSTVNVTCTRGSFSLQISTLWLIEKVSQFGLVIKTSIVVDKVLTWPGMTLLALGHVDISPTVQTRELESDSTDISLQWPSKDRKSLGCLQSLSNSTINSAAAAIGSWRIDIGTVPACPCEPLTVTCNSIYGLLSPTKKKVELKVSFNNIYFNLSTNSRKIVYQMWSVNALIWDTMLPLHCFMYISIL